MVGGGRLRLTGLSSADSADFPPSSLIPDLRGRYFEFEFWAAEGLRRLTAAATELSVRYDHRRLKGARGGLRMSREVTLPIRDAFVVRGPDETIRVMAQVNASAFHWVAHSEPVALCDLSVQEIAFIADLLDAAVETGRTPGSSGHGQW
jgi:hypothetical protein